MSGATAPDIPARGRSPLLNRRRKCACGTQGQYVDVPVALKATRRVLGCHAAKTFWPSWPQAISARCGWDAEHAYVLDEGGRPSAERQLRANRTGAGRLLLLSEAESYALAQAGGQSGRDLLGGGAGDRRVCRFERDGQLGAIGVLGALGALCAFGAGFEC